MTAEPPSRSIRLATRGSRLALIQAECVVALLRQRDPSVRIELLEITTHGDRNRDIPLAELAADDGVFTRGVEAELLAGRADLAVHSLKDLPTSTTPALALAAFPPRADARDALVAVHFRGFDDLPPGAVVGTSSPRRVAQALALRPDLRISSVRGNVDTRLHKLRAGEVDALLLAAAGLERLDRLGEATELLPVERFTPAVGQGALVAQCRADDRELCGLLAGIDDGMTRAAVTAERVFLAAVGGGCRVPVAAYAEVRGSHLRLIGFLSAPDGTRACSDALEGRLAEPRALGEALAERLLAVADESFLTEVRGG